MDRPGWIEGEKLIRRGKRLLLRVAHWTQDEIRSVGSRRCPGSVWGAGHDGARNRCAHHGRGTAADQLLSDWADCNSQRVQNILAKEARLGEVRSHLNRGLEGEAVIQGECEELSLVGSHGAAICRGDIELGLGQGADSPQTLSLQESGMVNARRGGASVIQKLERRRVMGPMSQVNIDVVTRLGSTVGGLWWARHLEAREEAMRSGTKKQGSKAVAFIDSQKEEQGWLSRSSLHQK